MTTRLHNCKFNLLILFLSIPLILPGQEASRDDLEVKRRTLLKEIQLTTELLSKTRKEKEVSLNQFLLLEKQIDQREKLIAGVQKSLQSTQQRIDKLERAIKTNEVKYRASTERYSAFLKESYRLSLRHNKWVFIFSTSSAGQMLQRWRYLRRLKDASLDQLRSIQTQQDSLLEHKTVLEREKKDQTALMRSQNDQKALLARDLMTKQKTLDKLNEDEKGLASNLRKQMLEQERLNAAIKKMINAKTRTSGVASSKLPETPESLRLSADFESNKGNLPWPVSRGVLVRPFGQRRHPTLKNVTTLNNGINIQVEPRTQVKAVFKGKIMDMRFIPGFNMVIMIKHGNYYTVYALLEDVVVSVGDPVENGQILGTAQANSETGLGEIHFEIWKQKELENPETWLKSK